jgi:hypothetical protein
MRHWLYLQETIAVIACQPHGSGSKPQEAKHLTILSLTATMASMIQVGFGQILVGYMNKQGDAGFAQEAFSMLVNRTSANNHGKGSLMIQIGNTEVGYASSSKEEVTSKITPII